MDISPTEDGWQVSCPRQSVEATRTRKRWKAEFDKSICAGCAFAEECRAREGQTARRWYFEAADGARQKRWKRWEAVPDERKKLRPNVEASVRQMQGAMADGKLKVRGAFQTQCYGLLRAIGVNLGRMARYLDDPDTEVEPESARRNFFEEYYLHKNTFRPFKDLVVEKSQKFRDLSLELN